MKTTKTFGETLPFREWLPQRVKEKQQKDSVLQAQAKYAATSTYDVHSVGNKEDKPGFYQAGVSNK